MVNRRQTVDYPPAIRAAAPTIAAIIRLMITATRLARGPGRLSPAEYLAHRLWDPDYHSGDLQRFAGLEGQGLFHRACCDSGWKAAADDKLISESIMRAGGITALPNMLAVVHPTRHHAGTAALKSMVDLLDFLRDASHYPLIAKPIDGVFSVGVIHAVSADPASDTLRSITRAVFPIPEVAARILRYQGGYLIQRALQPPIDLAAMSGGRLCTVRALALVTPSGTVIHRAALKVPVGRNVADNYWREGNRLGAIDVRSGQVARVMAGKAQHLRRDPVHPDTGVAIEGMAIPGWAELCDLVIRAASLFPGIRTQSWDVAITDAGPVILEINWGGDLHLHQIAHGEGILDPIFCAHLRSCGYQGRLPT